MDWSRFSHLSFSDLSGLVSRRTVILVLMAAILYQATGIFYKVLTLQLVRVQPAPAAAGKAQTAAIPAREPADSYRIISERNLFGTTTKAVTEKQSAAVPGVPAAQDVALLIDLRGTVAGGPKYGFAVVEEKATKKQRLVKAGDLVAGAKVVRIKRNAIDLLVNNQERTLKIVESKRDRSYRRRGERRRRRRRRPRRRPRRAVRPSSAGARSTRNSRTWGPC